MWCVSVHVRDDCYWGRHGLGEHAVVGIVWCMWYVCVHVQHDYVIVDDMALGHKQWLVECGVYVCTCHVIVGGMASGHKKSLVECST